MHDLFVDQKTASILPHIYAGELMRNLLNTRSNKLFSSGSTIVPSRWKQAATRNSWKRAKHCHWFARTIWFLGWCRLNCRKWNPHSQRASRKYSRSARGNCKRPLKPDWENWGDANEASSRPWGILSLHILCGVSKPRLCIMRPLFSLKCCRAP